MLYSMISRHDFEAAINCAHEAGRRAATSGLNAPLGAALLDRVAEVWDHIEAALRKAYQFGVEQAQDLLRTAVDQAENLLREAKARAESVEQQLQERLQGYLSGLLDRALQGVRSALTVGETRLGLVGIDVSQKITLTGSLKVSISELVALTGAGELTVVARYDVPGVIQQ
ncbi:hypothetical protein [Nocardia sp. NBC_00511]|uniref:hypothetical protein n=1 Tax=Nocardia sp. NBC_00511 TaxID=2903591 RepID=UPI0030E18B9E